ncbi:MAG: gamma-glutamylcyclotransferase family protein [Acidimicrobiia bacterium]
MNKTTLYFAYASFLDPDRIGAVSPNARFLFTAHFPETRLVFVGSDDVQGLASLFSESGQTVWGGVFEIPEDEVSALTDAEEATGRVAGWDTKAVDREGNKYDCLTFVAKASPNGDARPLAAELEAMIRGARHWSLPAGWVMGLEDLDEDPLLT